ncbi:MAG TPA: hypothetical protein VGQ32_02510 [Thermoanaerobaculia bacterium]|jgi:hypothetical protein|nr:hypothetical protein [Thermoanaerobaculia bacterium]
MSRQAHQAFQILRFGFTVAPIIAGADKFLHLLTDWDKYLAPFVPNALGIQPHTFMLIVGAVEIVAGLAVAFAPRFGGYLVAAWLAGIILNLVSVGGFLDVALRDLGLLLGAVSLARLAEAEVRVGVPMHAS